MKLFKKETEVQYVVLVENHFVMGGEDYSFKVDSITFYVTRSDGNPQYKHGQSPQEYANVEFSGYQLTKEGAIDNSKVRTRYCRGEIKCKDAIASIVAMIDTFDEPDREILVDHIHTYHTDHT